MEIYTHEDKIKLSGKINKIKSKTHCKKIFKIIKQDSNLGRVTGNTNGIFLMFHLLSNETCHKIDKYISSIKKKSLRLSANSDTIYSDSYNNNDPGESISGIEKINYDEMNLSNKEKNIINQRMYHDALIKMNSVA